MPKTTKLNLAVLGAKGLLGNALVKHFSEKYEVSAIDRENYADFFGKSFDILINANGNSRRFWANQNPLADLEASTLSVYRTFLDFKAEHYIYISSSNVYPDHTNPETTHEDQIIIPEELSAYGLHKYLSEQIVRRWAKKYFILRSSLMLGPGQTKGPFYDLKNNIPLFIALESRLQMITTREVAAVIDFLLTQALPNQIFNVGGQGTFAFSELPRYFPGIPTISPAAETQTYEMNTTKLNGLYPLQASEGYLQEYLKSL